MHGTAECSNYCTIDGIFVKQTKCTFFFMDWHISKNLSFSLVIRIYRVSIKSFPDYKHLLQENYVEYKHIFFF